MSKYFLIFVSLLLFIEVGIPTWLLLFFYVISFRVLWCFIFSIIITTIFLLAVSDRNELINNIIGGENLNKKIDAVEIFEDLQLKLCHLSEDLNMKANSINESETLVNSAKKILDDLEINRKNSAERYRNLLISLKKDVESTEKEVRLLQDEMKDLSKRRMDLKNEIFEAHEAIANFELRMTREGKNVTIVTQNIDGLHQKSGAKNVIELHGSLYKTRCIECDNIEINNTIPICPALAGKCSPDPDDMTSDIPVEDLPRCNKDSCGGLLRPHIVWFGESLETEILDAAENAVETCDACLIIGTSSLVYPAAMFAPRVAERGITVAEFNIEETDSTRKFQYHFQGPCTITVPEALAP